MVEELRDLLDSSPSTRSEVLLSHLATIATEELALAHLINAEAEKIGRINTRIATPFTPDEVIQFQNALCGLFAQIAKREESLLVRLRLILSKLQVEDEEDIEDIYSDDKPDVPSSPWGEPY